MGLLLDTNILIALQLKQKNIVDAVDNLTAIHIEPPAISFINYFEFYYGLFDKSIKSRTTQTAFIKKFNCLKATDITAEILAELKYKYEKQGVVIPLADVIIASHAKEYNLVLVTHDKAFEKIEEIKKVIID